MGKVCTGLIHQLAKLFLACVPMVAHEKLAWDQVDYQVGRPTVSPFLENVICLPQHLNSFPRGHFCDSGVIFKWKVRTQMYKSPIRKIMWNHAHTKISKSIQRDPQDSS